jgi:hypothetical protein
MEKTTETEILQEINKLLEKLAVDTFIPGVENATDTQHAEAVLINLKSLNARYDKHEAITHVQALMDLYNIQIDEVLDQIRY